jgi:hypothetical protein
MIVWTSSTEPDFDPLLKVNVASEAPSLKVIAVFAQLLTKRGLIKLAYPLVVALR